MPELDPSDPLINHKLPSDHICSASHSMPYGLCVGTASLASLRLIYRKNVLLITGDINQCTLHMASKRFVIYIIAEVEVLVYRHTVAEGSIIVRFEAGSVGNRIPTFR